MQPSHGPSDGSGRVVPFVRPGGAWPGANSHARPRPPIEDLKKFERAEGSEPEADDYRHRQLINLATFVICVLLVCTGLWLATRIAELRHDQDCVLAGHRNCAQISTINSAR